MDAQEMEKRKKYRREAGFRLIWYEKLLSILFILILLGTVHAKNNRIDFNRISLEEGLSQSSVYCMLQDQKGFLWFGTEDGLNKYDGYTFKVFRNEPLNPHSISYNYIKAMVEDTSGIMWIGTYSDGLNRFDREKERFVTYRHNRKNTNTLSNDFINALCLDNNGDLWVGTDHGLNRFRISDGTWTRFLPNTSQQGSISHHRIRALHVDRTGALWVGTDDGLCQYDPLTDRFFHVNLGRRDHVLSLFEDRKGLLWVGLENAGLYVIDPVRRMTIKSEIDNDLQRLIRNQSIHSIFEDKSGWFWIGTNVGLIQWNRIEGFFSHYQQEISNPRALSDNTVHSILEDQSGVLWFGTHVGLNKYDQEKKRFHHYQADDNDAYSLYTGHVRTIFEDQSGRIWVGTWGGGLNLFNRNGDRFMHYTHNPKRNSISNNFVYSICEDMKRNLWIGTEGGLNIFNPNTKKFSYFFANPDSPNQLSTNVIRVVYTNRAGTLWVGTADGLYSYDGKNKVFHPYKHHPDDPKSLTHNFIYSIYEDRLGTLWIGTLKGLSKFHPETHQFTQYYAYPEDQTGLSQDEVLSLYEDRAGNFWVGTAGGLNLMDRENQTFTYFLKSDELLNDVIYNILEDDEGNLWLSTNMGLSKFNPIQKTFVNYDVVDGLQSNEFILGAACRMRNGELFFGGVRGFNCFFSDQIYDNPHIPEVVITDFQMYNKSVPIETDEKSVLTKSISETEEITLSYKDRVFSFEFAALHYAAPQKNQYAYIMQGFDSEWNEIGNRRHATYTNLPSGDYVFSVRGSNNDGLWNEKGASLKIHITPPFYQKLWFQFLFAMGLLILILVIHKWRTYNILLHNKMLEERVEARTAELKKVNKGLNKEITVRKRIKREKEKLIKELREALAKVQTLHGMLPICSSCKKIRDDKGYWQQVEVYIRDHSDAEFTHGLCPECLERMFPDYIETKG